MLKHYERRCEQTKAVNLLLNARVMEAERYQVRPWLAMLKDADDTAEQLLAVALAHHANYTAALDAGRQLLAAWRAQRMENERLCAALRTIRDNYGHVCRAFDACSHVACRDSYSAWHIANDVLAELLNEA